MNKTPQDVLNDVRAELFKDFEIVLENAVRETILFTLQTVRKKGVFLNNKTPDEIRALASDLNKQYLKQIKNTMTKRIN